MGSRLLAFSTSSRFGFASAWRNCFKVIGVTLGLDRLDSVQHMIGCAGCAVTGCSLATLYLGYM